MSRRASTRGTARARRAHKMGACVGVPSVRGSDELRTDGCQLGGSYGWGMASGGTSALPATWHRQRRGGAGWGGGQG
eukprot:3388869-Prymnesium_polylepis.1